MKPRLLSVLVANLFVAAPALAQDAAEWSGSVSAGIRYIEKDAQDPSKFREYRDLEEGAHALFGFELRGRSQHNYFNAYGENLGRDDEYIDVNGGRYQTFKYRVYQDQLRHYFGSGPGALSPFSGIGGPVITAPFPLPAVGTWKDFDHSYRRRDTGGFFEWQKASPWYFRVDANEVKRDGINVYAGANGTSPGNGFTDLPVPIDWTTRNYAAEVGYSTKRGHMAVNLSYSTFENENLVLNWSNRFFGNGLDSTVLPPENNLVRLAVNGNLRQLPLDSTLAGRFTYSKLTNEVAMLPSMLSTGGVNAPTNPSSSQFDGELEKMTLGLAFNSRPTQALDTKLYYNWFKEDNSSTHMSFVPGTGLTGGTCTAANCSNHLFEYEKHQVGAEAGYRLTRANKLTGGLDYTDIDRERADFNNNEELRAFVEWKNSSFDWMTSRIKYQYMERSGDFNPDIATLTQNPMDLFVRRFDVANVDQNLVKLALDFTPAPLFDIGIEAIYKENKYKDTILGRTEDTRHEVYGSVGYGDPKRWRVYLFGDVEYVKFDSRHRVGTGNPDPNSGNTTTTYNWTSKNEDDAWQVGIGAEWAVQTRLKLKASAIYAETDGHTDFTVEAGGDPAPRPAITASDDTTRTSFNLRAVYELDRHWELTAGYGYEKYRFSDIAYDNTGYVAGALNSTSSGIVTGQFSFQNYEAHIGYLIAKYRFF
ncbi:MAG TPA: MtrB/PioB family decaheme-associated outer membrane protein [Burkholderiales bacterium]|nr:MtrB/PioB family decaheme-associated outer membrane protein [Burkholderiales bacterium]